MKQVVREIPVVENSFWAKWLTLNKALFKRCMAFTDQYHDAEDLLSEVMYKAYLKGPSDEKSLKHFENWLGKLAKNIAIDIRRHNEKIVHTEDIEILLMDKSLENSRSPQQDLIYEEQLQAVNESIKDVSSNYRHVVQSFFVDGYSYEDIINTYSLNAEYVRKIVSVARKKITACLNLYESGGWNDNTMPNPEVILEEEDIYDHSIMIGTPQNFHFCTVFTDVTPGRLIQKEKSFRDYLEKTPNSGFKRLLLAKNLLSQGKLVDAENELDTLLNENYNDNEVFEYKILISKLLERKDEVQSLANLALDKIPSPPTPIKAIQMQYNKGKESARDFYRMHLNNNPEDINSRVEYIKLLNDMNLHEHAYEECLILQKLSPNNLKILPYLISYKLKFEGVNAAGQYSQTCFKSNRDSIFAAIYYLHFLVRDYKVCKNNKNIQLILNRLRKKYYWHPDYALIKAIIVLKKDGDSTKRTKILKRRCTDYPDCVISKYYLKKFGKVNKRSLPDLPSSVSHHLELILSIHSNSLKAESGAKYATK